MDAMFWINGRVLAINYAQSFYPLPPHHPFNLLRRAHQTASPAKNNVGKPISEIDKEVSTPPSEEDTDDIDRLISEIEQITQESR